MCGLDLENTEKHEIFMRLALREAEKAAKAGEVPIGCVIVRDGKVVGRGRNRIESGQDPTLHAEMIAIRAAAKRLGAKWLIGCTLYVTVEPCSMCAGAAVLARLDAVVAGAESGKSGGCGSVKDILDSDSLNHRVAYRSGVLKGECALILSGFFRELRAEKKEQQTDE
ncbi:MAG: tRNA adenosine(34) deaminase TadA [Clostridiales Family XIII bacterium]|jgi:tRNA(adenine34) deaminase|nr:tRNA adenosine(34) deaminase TadA [Clostridiales Family XIII bacterium]